MQLALYGKVIFVYSLPVDFRMGIEGLSNLIKETLKKRPDEGVYIFYNRSKRSLKLLSWHKNGYILIYKKLSRGSFPFKGLSQTNVIEIKVQEVSWLLAGLEWQKMRVWRDLNYDALS